MQSEIYAIHIGPENMATGAIASADIAKGLQQLETAPPAEKAQGYNDLLTKILSTSSPDSLASNLIAYIESLLGDSLSIITSRPLLSAFVERFKTVKDPEVKIEVGQRVLELLQPKVVSFEEQDSAIKEILAESYIAQEDFSGAAKILQTVTLDSQQRKITADDKAQLWIRIVRCYLEDGDSLNANSYLNRIKNIYPDIQNKETKVHYDLSRARILDAQRSFLDASAAYHGISQETIIDEEERLQCLSQAIICAVLAPAGPQRGRMLAKLYKDDRANQVEEYSILEKIFLDRLLSPEEVRAFSEKLHDHQKATTSDGSTVLDKAVLEHNLLGASRLYSNIGIDQLGVLLGVDSEKAEERASKMIEQGRLAGYIDQIDRVIFFEGEGSGEKKTGHGDAVVGRELRKWDTNVQALAEEVERVTSMIQDQHPEFYTAHMVH